MSRPSLEKTIPLVKAYILKCRPVWTITWRDCAAPTIRSGVPDVREEDLYFNKQLAIECIVEFGRETLAQRMKQLKEYIGSNECKNAQFKYKVKSPSGYCHNVYTEEIYGFQHFMGLITYEARHNHALKFK